MRSALIVVAAVAALGPAEVHAHGVMTVPKARNMVSRERGQQYCEHCLNGGSVGNVIANDVNGGVWLRNMPPTDQSEVRHGLCGGPAGADQHMLGGAFYNGGTVQAEYEEGGQIDITISINAHHHGWFEFYLCDTATLGGGPVTQSCFNQHKLLRDPNDPHSDSPYNPAYPGRFYMLPRCHPDGWLQTMRYVLPAGVTCEHCVLQWWWVTANSCNGGGYEGVQFPNTYTDCNGDGGATGWLPRANSECTTSSGYPEEFWNCADIRILSSEPTPPPVPTPAPVLQPTAGPAPTAEPAPTAGPAPTPGPSSGTCERTLSTSEDCSGAPDCCPPGRACYRKNQWWAGCLETCEPGMTDSFDSLPWECALLGGEPEETSPPTLPNPSPDPVAQPSPSPQPSPSQSPTVASSPTASGACQALYQQCDGNGFAGETNCCEGTVCVGGTWYKQCRPDPNRTCKIRHDACTNDPDSCCSGYTCTGNQWYKACL